jgi:hypothetical protein
MGSEGSASKYSRSISWLVTDLAHIILPETKRAKSNEKIEQRWETQTWPRACRRLHRDDAVVHLIVKNGAAIAAKDARLRLQLNVSTATECTECLSSSHRRCCGFDSGKGVGK